MKSEFVQTLAYARRHPKVRRLLAWQAWIWGAAFLALALAWFPVWQRSRGAEKVLEARDEAATRAKRDAAFLSAFEASNRALRQAEGKLSYVGSQSELVRNLSSLAAEHGLRVQTDVFEAPQKRGRASVMTQTLTLGGSYAGIRKFLADLADLPTYTVPLHLRLEAGDQSVTADMRLATFTLSRWDADEAP